MSTGIFILILLPGFFCFMCNNDGLQNTPSHEIHYNATDYTQNFSDKYVTVDYKSYSKSGIQHHQWTITSPQNTLINVTFFAGWPYNLNPTADISCESRKSNLKVVGLMGQNGTFCIAPGQYEDIRRNMTTSLSSSNSLLIQFQVDTAFVKDSNFSLRYEVGRFCAEEITIMDEYTVQWNPAFMCREAVSKCPYSTEGYMSRRCIEIDGYPKWGRPNLEHCVSLAMKNIYNEAESLRNKSVVSSSSILNVTSSLADIIAKRKSNTSLYPGDLTEATRTVVTISDVTENASVHEYSLLEIAEGYGKAVNEIVDPETTNTWKILAFSTVERKFLNILNSVEIMSSHIARKKISMMKKRFHRSASNYSLNDRINVLQENIDFEISFHERVAICEDTVGLNVGPAKSDRLILTSSVFKAAIGSTKDKFIQIYTGRFPTIPNILSSAAEEETKYNYIYPNISRQSQFISSDIVSARVLNTPESAYRDLTHPITIVFRVDNTTWNSSYQRTCVALNMTDGSMENRWSTEGCHLDPLQSNLTHAVCVCSHLTNFAILMDVFDVQSKIDHDNSMILTIMTYIGCGLSIIGCLITVVIFEFFRLKKERIKIHEQLAISIIMVQIIYLVGIDRTENKYACMSMAILLHYFLLSMFCWMLIEGFHLYVMLVQVFKANRNFKKYLAFGWGLPIVIVGISAGIFHDEYGSNTVCWLTRKVLLVAFVPAVGLLILLNTIVLFVVLRTMMRSISVSAKIGTDERSSVRTGLKAAAVLLPILGLTWTLGFFSIDSKDTLVFTYLFTFLNSLQGVFFFLFHCLMSTDVKTAFERRSQRKSRSSLSATLGKSNKRDRLIDNRKSSSTDTSLTDVSLSHKLTPTTNRLSQMESNWDNYGYDHPTEFFTRSFSDGIPSWKNINNLRALHTHYQTADDIYSKHGLHQRQFEQSKEQSIEDLYSKPLKRRDRENHVHFNDDMVLTERKLGTISPPGMKLTNFDSPYTTIDKNWSKSFLAEIQEKANNIKLRNNLAIENGKLEV
ncbi:adhesion G protein-coupled receptor L4-like [Saccostrea cucullata]|uniref:adhesion G protein-coupled receptor L4-like n=1 Tax=Saccostrea cuccullata TaxID=36930 RepID=UPI002ED3F045